MTHRYAVGDDVCLAYGFFDRDAVGTYSVTRLLPVAGDGKLQYRIVGDDCRERVISESQIARDAFGGHGGPRSPHNPITEMFNRLNSAASGPLKPEPIS